MSVINKKAVGGQLAVLFRKIPLIKQIKLQLSFVTANVAKTSVNKNMRIAHHHSLGRN